MSAQITTLITGPDNFEALRDEIAAIIALESEGQQDLAAAEDPPLDPAPWKLRVFTERLRPWAFFADAPDQDHVDATPIVNVWFDNASIVMAGSNTIERQKMLGVFHVDVYGYGESAETEEYEGAGHISGDEKAATEAHRAARLVRQILMAGQYTYLGLRGTVARRWVQSLTTLKPPEDNVSVQNVQAVRLALHVEFNEFSPQYQPETLQLLSLTAKRAVTGQVYFTAKFESEDS